MKSMPISTPSNLPCPDKYPNHKIVDKINSLDLPNIEYSSIPVDALEIDKSPGGLKTMIASFHHMSPNVAKKILASAEASKEPMLIYEIAENNIPIIIWWLFLPLSLLILVLMSLIMTPFVRPLTITQIIFTYLIPIIPLVYAWDGQTSIMRTYTFEDIKSLLGENKDGSYVWEINQAKNSNGRKAGYYIFGYSKKLIPAIIISTRA